MPETIILEISEDGDNVGSVVPLPAKSAASIVQGWYDMGAMAGYCVNWVVTVDKPLTMRVEA